MQIDPSFVSQARILAKKGQIKTSRHALRRLAERKVSICAVEDAIVNGSCISQEPPGEDDSGKQFQYDKLTFYNSKENVSVVVALSCPLLVITVFYE